MHLVRASEVLKDNTFYLRISKKEVCAVHLQIDTQRKNSKRYYSLVKTTIARSWFASKVPVISGWLMRKNITFFFFQEGTVTNAGRARFSFHCPRTTV